MPTQAIFTVGGEADCGDPRHVHYTVNLYELDEDQRVVGLPIEVATAKVPMALLHDGDETLTHAIMALRVICYQLELKLGSILESRSVNVPQQLSLDDTLGSE